MIFALIVGVVISLHIIVMVIAEVIIKKLINVADEGQEETQE